MTSESERAAIVRRWTEAFNRLDMDAVMEDIDPQIELSEWPTAPGARTYHGVDGVRQALDTWFEAWEWMRVEVEDIVEVDDRLLVTLHQRAKGKGSAVEVEIRSFNVYTFSGPLIVSIQLFTDEEPALEAAGLAADQTEGRSP